MRSPWLPLWFPRADAFGFALHFKVATTERYLRLTISDFKEAHARFYPREKA